MDKKKKNIIKNIAYSMSLPAVTALPIATVLACGEESKTTIPTEEAVDPSVRNKLEQDRFIEALKLILSHSGYRLESISFDDYTRDESGEGFAALFLKINVTNIATGQKETRVINILGDQVADANDRTVENAFKTEIKRLVPRASDEEISWAYALLRSSSSVFKEYRNSVREHDINALQEWLIANGPSLVIDPKVTSGAPVVVINAGNFVIPNNGDGKIRIQNIFYRQPASDEKIGVVTFDVIYGDNADAKQTLSRPLNFQITDNEAREQSRTDALPPVVRLAGSVSQALSPTDMGDQRAPADSQAYIDAILNKYYQSINTPNPYADAVIANVHKNPDSKPENWNASSGSYVLTFDAYLGNAPTPKTITMIASWSRDIFNSWLSDNDAQIAVRPALTTAGPVENIVSSDIILPNNTGNRYAISNIQYEKPTDKDRTSTTVRFDLFDVANPTIRTARSLNINFAKSENQAKTDALTDITFDERQVATKLQEQSFALIDTSTGQARETAFRNIIVAYYRAINNANPNTVTPFDGATLSQITPNKSVWDATTGRYQITFRAAFGAARMRSLTLNASNVLTNAAVGLQQKTNALPDTLAIDGSTLTNLSEADIDAIFPATGNPNPAMISVLLTAKYHQLGLTDPYTGASFTNLRRDRTHETISSGSYSISFGSAFGNSVPKTTTITLTHIISNARMQQITAVKAIFAAALHSSHSLASFNSLDLPENSPLSDLSQLGITLGGNIPSELTVTFKKEVSTKDIVYTIKAPNFGAWSIEYTITADLFTTTVDLPTNVAEMGPVTTEGITLSRVAYAAMEQSATLPSLMPFVVSGVSYQNGGVATSTASGSSPLPFVVVNSRGDVTISFKIRARSESQGQSVSLESLLNNAGQSWTTHAGISTTQDMREDEVVITYRNLVPISGTFNGTAMTITGTSTFAVPLTANASYSMIFNGNRISLKSSFTDSPASTDGALAFVTDLSGKILSATDLEHRSSVQLHVDNLLSPFEMDGRRRTISSADFVDIIRSTQTTAGRLAALAQLIHKYYQGGTEVDPYQGITFVSIIPPSMADNQILVSSSFNFRFTVQFGVANPREITLNATNVIFGSDLGTQRAPTTAATGADVYQIINDNTLSGLTGPQIIANMLSHANRPYTASANDISNISIDSSTPYSDDAHHFIINFRIIISGRVQDAQIELYTAQSNREFVTSTEAYSYGGGTGEIPRTTSKYESQLGLTLERRAIVGDNRQANGFTFTNIAPNQQFISNGDSFAGLSWITDRRIGNSNFVGDKSEPFAVVNTGRYTVINFGISAYSIIDSSPTNAPQITDAQRLFLSQSASGNAPDERIDGRNIKVSAYFDDHGNLIGILTEGKYPMIESVSPAGTRGYWFASDVNANGDVVRRGFVVEGNKLRLATEFVPLSSLGGATTRFICGAAIWITSLSYQVLPLSANLANLVAKAPFQSVAASDFTNLHENAAIKPGSVIYNYDATSASSTNALRFTVAKNGIEVANALNIPFFISPKEAVAFAGLPSNLNINPQAQGASQALRLISESDFLLIRDAQTAAAKAAAFRRLITRYYTLANIPNPFAGTLAEFSNVGVQSFNNPAGSYAITADVSYISGGARWIGPKQITINASNIISLFDAIQSKLSTLTEISMSQSTWNAAGPKTTNALLDPNSADGVWFLQAVTNLREVYQSLNLPTGFTMSLNKAPGTADYSFLLSYLGNSRTVTVTPTRVYHRSALGDASAGGHVYDASGTEVVRLRHVALADKQSGTFTLPTDQRDWLSTNGPAGSPVYSAFEDLKKSQDPTHPPLPVAEILGNDQYRVDFDVVASYAGTTGIAGIFDKNVPSSIASLKERLLQNPNSIPKMGSQAIANTGSVRNDHISVVYNNGALTSILFNGVPMTNTAGPVISADTYWVSVVDSVESNGGGWYGVRITNNKIYLLINYENARNNNGVVAFVQGMSAGRIGADADTSTLKSVEQEIVDALGPTDLQVDGTVHTDVVKSLLGDSTAPTNPEDYLKSIFAAIYSTPAVTNPFLNPLLKFENITKVAANWDIRLGSYKITYSVIISGVSYARSITLTNIHNQELHWLQAIWVDFLSYTGDISTVTFAITSPSGSVTYLPIFSSRAAVPANLLDDPNAQYVIIQDQTLAHAGEQLNSLVPGPSSRVHVPRKALGIHDANPADPLHRYWIDPETGNASGSIFDVWFVNIPKIVMDDGSILTYAYITSTSGYGPSIASDPEVTGIKLTPIVW